ncbi:hypothetical protein H4696_009661 [Amycolatopsis lexingtonensis]|uniref:Uncharacterized protein n=1 Tax=Amycolatopsis lexingtonensis TaxID=218822 RepID=A0ABR9IHB6_9PSEU|nr:hypothetical protein [Amycolatopsis lexingtonensis]MBE1502561.1 hypothetical protein [Amycolatopsis lexingtonensis]
MEPLTAISVIAAKYGVSQLVGALSGDDDLGGLAAELLGAVTASEDRLSTQLAGLGRQLDELLDQRYTTALAAGQRTLRDLVSAPSEARQAEWTRARDLFREASATARSPLQEAVAERYVALCFVALGWPDAARTAWGEVNRAAFEALMDALPLVGPAAYDRAREQAGLSSRGRRSARREREVDEKSREIIAAAGEAVPLALSLLAEPAALSDDAGPHVELIRPEGFGTEQRLTRPAQVWITPGGPDQGQFRVRPEDRLSPLGLRQVFGPLSVEWTLEGHSDDLPRAGAMAKDLDEVRAVVKQVAPAAVAELGEKLLGTLWLHMSSIAKPDNDFAVVVRADPGLRRPLDLFLANRVEVPYLPTLFWGWPRTRVLEPGEAEIRLREAAYGGDFKGFDGSLFLNGVLAFHNTDRTIVREPRWEEIRWDNRHRLGQ